MRGRLRGFLFAFLTGWLSLTAAPLLNMHCDGHLGSQGANAELAHHGTSHEHNNQDSPSHGDSSSHDGECDCTEHCCTLVSAWQPDAEQIPYALSIAQVEENTWAVKSSSAERVRFLQPLATAPPIV